MAKYLIDITRFISRIGRGKPTGIDRVEIAYIKELSKRDPDCLAIAKISQDFILLSAKDAMTVVEAVERDQQIGRLGVRDSYRLKLPKAQRRARQFLRASSINQARTAQDLLAKFPLQGVEYVNVGHSNLSDTFLRAVQDAGCRMSVMIHDMIPLDFPKYTREGISAQFEKKTMCAMTHSDRIICNSADTETRVNRYADQWGIPVNTIVAHLGVEPMEMMPRPEMKKPYFVCLGTIEPRKNHALLFEMWRLMAEHLAAEEIPALHIVGRRGWENDAVFRLLDTSPLMGVHIFERSDLDDDALAQQIGHSAGLLFPSHVEGYGLPALEAAQIGIPVICSELPVFHEILQGNATFVDTQNAQAWCDAVQTVAKMARKATNDGDSVPKPMTVPRWESHFCHVFGDTGDRAVIHE